MKKQPWVSFQLAGVSLTDFGLAIPSPFTSLELSNSEVTSMTSWSLRVVVGGDANRKINIAAFEALLYSAAQEASGYSDSSGIPVSFSFGWLNEHNQIAEYLSYQGFTLQYKVSTSGLYMNYDITGFASLAMQSNSPVLRIPEVSGVVQPSAIVEGLAKAVKATNYYELDIDHNDAPTLITHGAMTTSFNRYIRGNFSLDDDYDSFPGLLPLSKSYSAAREGTGLRKNNIVKKLSQVVNNIKTSNIDDFFKTASCDTTPQCASFSYWVDEPSMTHPGVIHYKSNASLTTSQVSDTLRYGTKDSNILSLSGSYSGVAYNMTDMSFKTLGFSLDASGNTIIQDGDVVNSWSASLANVFQTANIINDINAIATQFSGDFNITIAGSTKQYSVAQPVSLVVMSGNTLSPISGIYNIISVTHTISTSFITSLKIQRLTLSSANQTATGQGIFVTGSSAYTRNAYTTTKNIKSPYKVEFGDIYPDFTHMYNINL